MKPRLWQTITRSARLRCPNCGQGPVAKNWRETYEACLHCGFDFCVEGGFYLGAIYLNYGLMAVLTLSIGMPLVWFGYASPLVTSAVGTAVCIVLGIWFWRYSRSLWLGLGYFLDHNVRAGSQTAAAADELVLRTNPHLEGETLACSCPFCHGWFRFAESKRHSWGACPRCQERILLTPAQRPQASPGLDD